MNTPTKREQTKRHTNKETSIQTVKQAHGKLEKRGVTGVRKRSFKIERRQYTQKLEYKKMRINITKIVLPLNIFR